MTLTGNTYTKTGLSPENNKGQALLFVIVAVTMAMAVGISVSTRTIQSLRRASRTDTSARVIAAAEGGIENLLGRNYSQLDAAIDDGSVDCDAVGAVSGPESEPGTCSYVFSEGSDGGAESSGDKISSRAIVKVETFSTNEENGYAFDLTPGMVKEVYLPSSSYSSNKIQICFKSDESAIYYYSYRSDGTILKGGLYPHPGNVPSGMLSRRFEQATIANKGGTIGNAFCREVNLVSGHYGLRIKTLFSPTKVIVYPISGYSLPTQGYKLTSRGEVSEGATEERATVIVHKSYPYAADVFDYGIYTPSDLTGGD